MATIARVILLTALLSSLTSCSVYRNKGRDQFEARAAGQVKTNIGTAAVPTEDVQLREDTASCWIQEANEPLWSTPVGSSLEVRRLNESQISVCQVETPPHEESKND